MPIGIFDSGYGGLTILREIRRRLPQYDYVYLGDNARAPYGTRSFELVYGFTLEAVKALFERGCNLVIFACNTASAKALRSIQQNDLPQIDPSRRVLGVIRPTVESLAGISKTGHIGVLGTPGTVASHSYALELEKSAPDMKITEYACPMWVPLVENNEAASPGADYFVAEYIDGLLEKDPEIDTIVLGCTHFPMLIDKIRNYVGDKMKIIAQGGIVAESLADYLMRHPEIDEKCEKNGSIQYLTTENPEKFNSIASMFMQEDIEASRVILPIQSLDTIREFMPAEALPLLDSYIALHPNDDEGYRIRGIKHWALGQRSSAINDYLAAIRINPDSKAKMALRTTYDILNYYNKDLLNP
ncbi:MAG: glutamate racemase [Bacteroides sp.]|nr:glutamate racemase [Bacteroides sp.]